MYTDKKENKISLIYREIQIAKSYMRKGFLIYEEMHKYMTLHQIPLNFLIYDENTDSPVPRNGSVGARVSFETSFDSKQPKLEPKLVLALSETKRLFRLFRFYTETASFGVSIESKQTKDQPKQTETNGNESNMKII